MSNGRDSPQSFQTIADEVDHSTCMICPYCRGESAHLKRKHDDRYCPKCDRLILTLCNRPQK